MRAMPTRRAPSSQAAPRRDMDDLALEEAPMEKEVEKKAGVRACKPSISVENKQGISNPDGLSRLIARVASGEACSSSPLKLRITVDTKGHILRVDRVGGDPALAARLAKMLKGKPSGTKAITGIATVFITLELK